MLYPEELHLIQIILLFSFDATLPFDSHEGFLLAKLTLNLPKGSFEMIHSSRVSFRGSRFVATEVIPDNLRLS
jgi:hypothetical protein